MIEARTAGELSTQQQASTTPQTITTSMVTEDLDNGIDRDGIRLKYNLEKWEVAEMFKHPALKGKKVKKARRLSFQFLDDTKVTDTAQTSIPMETPSLEETADMLYGVDNTQAENTHDQGANTHFNTQVENTFDQQTRVEEGLDPKGESFENDSNETLDIN